MDNFKNVFYLEYDLARKSHNVGEDLLEYIKIFNGRSDCKYRLLEHKFTANKLCIIVEGEQEDLATTMRGVNGSFAKYFNRRYLRQGRVFKQRYKSIPIESKEKYQFYSNCLSKNSNKTHKSNNLYNDIIAYAIEKHISIASILYPKNKQDKLIRQDLIKELLVSKKYPISNITKVLKISKSTIFRIIKCINF